MKINVMQQFFVFLGVIGAIVCFCGVIHPTSNGVSAIGAILLLAASIFYKLNYFIALEVIVLASHGAVFFGLGPVVQLILPILLCIQLLVYYLLSGQLSAIKVIGITGIALLPLGVSYNNQVLVFFGCAFIATYSFYVVGKGARIVLIWAFLNTAFALGTAIRLVL